MKAGPVCQYEIPGITDKVCGKPAIYVIDVRPRASFPWQQTYACADHPDAQVGDFQYFGWEVKDGANLL